MQEEEKNDFVKGEIRNGYFVSGKMKRVWLIQLEILKNIKSICKKYNIQYFATCGTLIGAIRENGFIPWDDDIDIGMTRENALKFINAAKKELPNNYCLVGTTLTKHLFRPHLQIRNKDTSCLTKADFYLTYCKGVWVDIFIFDKFPTVGSENLKFRRKLSRIKKMFSYYTFYRFSKNFVKKAIKYLISRIYVILNGGFENCNKKYNRLCQKFDYLKDNYYYDYLAYKPDRILKFPPHVFDETVEHPFEFTTISIPKDFHSALVPEYGEDYMVRKEAPNGHGDVFIDLDNSYLKYEKLTKHEFYKLFDEKEGETKK